MKFAFAVLAAFLVLGHETSAQQEARFLAAPDVRDERIVFNYEGDLWSVGIAGGTAQRLTAHPGNEDTPKIAPNGKHVVFAADYDGPRSLYLMPIEGGEPQRVTWFGTRVQPVAWTPDGAKIVFRSSHENTFRPITKLYQVSPAGEYPERLPVERGILCSFAPDGRKMVYNRRGNEEYYWKRYKGGDHTDVWRYDFVSNEFTPLTDYVGKNAYPMWVGQTMYFVSDRRTLSGRPNDSQAVNPSEIANLFQLDLSSGALRMVTKFADFDVQMPSSDGRRIVFVQKGRLWILDSADDSMQPVTVSVPTDRWQLRERTINPRDYIQSMSVSNDGKLAVFEARGDLFTVPADDPKATRNLTGTSNIRERMPKIAPDGKSVAFYSDQTGDYQIYAMSLPGPGSGAATEVNREALTHDLDRTAYHLEWSPDGKKILFGNKDFALFWIDVATKARREIARSDQLKNDEFYWEVSDYCWSPDSRWVAYSLVQFNRNNKIFLYDTETAASHAITDEFYDSMNPSFDPDGELLYFLSYRNFGVEIDIFEDNHVIPDPVQVMAVQLRAGQRPPFADDGPVAAAATYASGMTVDIDGIAARTFPVPVAPGNLFYLKAGKGIVTWARKDSFGDPEIEEVFAPNGADQLKLHVFDRKSKQSVALEPTISDWRFSCDGTRVIFKKGGDYYVSAADRLFASKTPGDKLILDSMSYHVRPLEEWQQIFADTWRWYRDFFYDPDMHGHDWRVLGEKFRPLVGELHSRAQLNGLLSQMVGELCVSHTYVNGGDFGPSRTPDNPTLVGYLGVELAPDPSGWYRISRLFGPTRYNADLVAPLSRPDRPVVEGDFLVAIDGRELKMPDNPYRFLQVTRGQRVQVSVNAAPGLSGARTYEVEPLATENALRYERWIADNIATVLEESGGDVGYMHFTAMGAGNIAQFDKYWRAFRTKKGLIIDVRGNGGGWTEYFMIDKLERQMVAYNVLRQMEPFRYPGSTSQAHLVVLTNEYNGSDGEAFVEHFKARKLGTVIGVPSWGGLVGIVNGQKTLDNGIVHQSNNSFYGKDGRWLVENHGADPDLLVENDPQSASAGQDRQLETALEFLKRKISHQPFQFPERPAYPRR